MYYVIVNPASKSGKGHAIWTGLEPIFQEQNVPYRVLYSKGVGHVTKAVAKLTAPDKNGKAKPLVKLIILGGDGTVNEALQGIQDFERIWLGYIPTGSSNDLARDLQLPKDPSVILRRILDGGYSRTMDLGLLTYTDTSGERSRIRTNAVHSQRYFAVSSGIGFDAAVCEEALSSRFKNILNKMKLGKLTYLIIALRQLIAAKSASCDIYLDDGQTPIHFDRFLFTAFMIHKYEGGGFKFCPMADERQLFRHLVLGGTDHGLDLGCLDAVGVVAGSEHVGYGDQHGPQLVEGHGGEPVFIVPLQHHHNPVPLLNACLLEYLGIAVALPADVREGEHPGLLLGGAPHQGALLGLCRCDGVHHVVAEVEAVGIVEGEVRQMSGGIQGFMAKGLVDAHKGSLCGSPQRPRRDCGNGRSVFQSGRCPPKGV